MLLKPVRGRDAHKAPQGAKKIKSERFCNQAVETFEMVGNVDNGTQFRDGLVCTIRHGTLQGTNPGLRTVKCVYQYGICIMYYKDYCIMYIPKAASKGFWVWGGIRVFRPH